MTKTVKIQTKDGLIEEKVSIEVDAKFIKQHLDSFNIKKLVVQENGHEITFTKK